MRIALAVLALASLVTASSSGAAQPAKEAGLCSPTEEEIFVCKTAKALAYVCASKPFKPDVSVMQYRFGSPGKIQLQYPASPALAAGHFRMSSTAYSGGGEGHLAFSNDGYDYILYDRTTAGDWDKQGHRAHTFATGILVRKGKAIVSNIACQRADDTLRAGAYDLPKEDFNYDAVP